MFQKFVYKISLNNFTTMCLISKINKRFITFTHQRIRTLIESTKPYINNNI